MLRILACGLTLILLSACGATDDQPTTAGSPAASSSTTDDSGNSPNPCLGSAGNTPEDPRSDEQMTEPYLGLTEQEAEALAKDEGHTLRVAGRDDECFALTMDYREDRVNIYLEDGTVTAATRG